MVMPTLPERISTGGIETEIDITFVRSISASKGAEQVQFGDTVLFDKPILVLSKNLKDFLAGGCHGKESGVRSVSVGTTMSESRV